MKVIFAIIKFPFAALALVIWSVAYFYIFFFKLWLCMFFLIPGLYSKILVAGDKKAINFQYTNRVRSFQKSINNYCQDVKDSKSWVFKIENSLQTDLVNFQLTFLFEVTDALQPPRIALSDFSRLMNSFSQFTPPLEGNLIHKKSPHSGGLLNFLIATHTRKCGLQARTMTPITIWNKLIQPKD